ncbi:hypothetical protein J5N97_000921 [Dioscorea zingiberensis]|uniref:LOB domain-containing protein n=1 Tax=Dioscorea zingiberensis TaxID=325984 RepID=A0A9D5BUX8_9LILI|nr:hypothetical protein J5N97_000921 [Dioscorea zingiberensis]
MVSTDTIRTMVGLLGNVIALALFLSPLPTIRRIWKNKTVEQFSAVPYLATLLNCMLWVVYGLPLVHPHSTLVLTINGSGMAIELFYVLMFIVYSDKKSRPRVLSMFAAELVFVMLVAVMVFLFVHTHQQRSMVVGVLCVFFGTMMYAAPLSVMKLVIQTKSVEYMPLTLSVASFLNGLCWTTYALLRFDLYITIPNGLGVMFSIAQLALYAIYYKSTQKEMEEKKLNEGMAMQEVVVVGEPPSKAYRAAAQNGADPVLCVHRAANVAEPLRAIHANVDVLLAGPLEDKLPFLVARLVLTAIARVEEERRDDAVKALVYEAYARLRDPVYGCTGAIFYLQKCVEDLESQLREAQEQVLQSREQKDQLMNLLRNKELT